MGRNKQFAVLGLGRFGRSIVQSLSNFGCDVLCCDKDINIVSEMSKYSTRAVQIDVTNEEALLSLGLNNFDVVVIAIGGDMEASLMATLIAKEIGVKYVVTKAKSLRQSAILQRIGADKVVLPERDSGVRLATSLVTSNVFDYISLSDEFSIAEISPINDWINCSIKDSNIRAKYKLNIVAIKRDGDVIVTPSPDEVVYETDILVVIGETDRINNLSK